MSLFDNEEKLLQKQSRKIMAMPPPKYKLGQCVWHLRDARYATQAIVVGIHVSKYEYLYTYTIAYEQYGPFFEEPEHRLFEHRAELVQHVTSLL